MLLTNLNVKKILKTKSCWVLRQYRSALYVLYRFTLMSSNYVSNETWSGNLDLQGDTSYFKFQGLKVWDTPFLYALFVFYCLTAENPLKISLNLRFQ